MKRNIKVLLLIIIGLSLSLSSVYYVDIYRPSAEVYYAVLVNGQVLAFFAYLFAFIEISMVFFNFKE